MDRLAIQIHAIAVVGANLGSPFDPPAAFLVDFPQNLDLCGVVQLWSYELVARIVSFAVYERHEFP